MSIFIPRVLIIIYIVQTIGVDTPWFWVHLVFAIFAYGTGIQKPEDAKNG